MYAGQQASDVTLRSHGPGDLDWIVRRHAGLYAESHRWNATFAEMVQEIVDDLEATYDPEREHVWIAEAAGRRVGAIALVAESPTVALLRLFFVEPEARGHGVGRRLVEACLSRAREVGYSAVSLDTVRSLEAAGHLYRQHGLTLVHEEPIDIWGPPDILETWRLDLLENGPTNTPSIS
jgi:GNAT superfamily N-acetyltransferase